MASAMFAKAKKAFLDKDIDMLDDDIRCVLVDATDFTLDLAAHDFLDDIPAGARVGVSGALQTKTTTGGVFNADPITVTGVSGDQFEYIIIYKHTGTEGTSNLIACVDTATGIPCTPNGGDITITWSTGASKIFAL
jgi:hypothetical protein